MEGKVREKVSDVLSFLTLGCVSIRNFRISKCWLICCAKRPLVDNLVFV